MSRKYLPGLTSLAVTQLKFSGEVFLGGTESIVESVLPADIFLCADKVLFHAGALFYTPELSFKSPPLSLP